MVKSCYHNKNDVVTTISNMATVVVVTAIVDCNTNPGETSLLLFDGCTCSRRGVQRANGTGDPRRLEIAFQAVSGVLDDIQERHYRGRLDGVRRLKWRYREDRVEVWIEVGVVGRWCWWKICGVEWDWKVVSNGGRKERVGLGRWSWDKVAIEVGG